MKYSVTKCINGTFTIDSEFSDIEKAKIKYHGVCQTLWNAKDVITAKVKILDENLDCVENYAEFIYHNATETE